MIFTNYFRRIYFHLRLVLSFARLKERGAWMTSGELPSEGSPEEMTLIFLNEEQWHLVVGSENNQTFERKIQVQTTSVWRTGCEVQPSQDGSVKFSWSFRGAGSSMLHRSAGHGQNCTFILSDLVKSTFPQMILHLFFALRCTGLVININVIADVYLHLPGLPVTESENLNLFLVFNIRSVVR